MKKKMKRGQAVLSAWTLIAAMGVTPVLSVSYPNGIATVYAKEAVNEAVEEAGYSVFLIHLYSDYYGGGDQLYRLRYCERAPVCGALQLQEDDK